MAKIQWRSDDERLIDLKQEKIVELKSATSKKIIEGYFCDIDKKTYFFTYSVEKQMNLQDTYQMFINNMITEINWNCYNNNGEKVRIKLYRDNFEKLYLSGIKHKNKCISILNEKLIPIVEEANTTDKVGSIYWDENFTFPDMVLKTNDPIDKRLEKVAAKTRQLEGDSMNTMMALVQISGMIK